MIFTLDYRPRFRDSDADGLVSARGYLNYFQDVASGHFHSLKKGNDTLPERYGVAWVYSRYKLKIFSKADFSEVLRISSWVSRCDAARVWQEMEVKRGEELLCAGRLESCVVNLSENRICRTSEIELPADLVEDRFSSVEPFEKRRKKADEADFAYTYKVAYTDIDKSRHMNNLHYADMFLNAFTPAFFDSHIITDFEIQYIRQAYFGEELTVLKKEDGDAMTLFAVNRDGALTASCVFRTKCGN